MLFEHQGRNHVRYYDKDNQYVDHGRMIYPEIPKVDDIVSPFSAMKGGCKWRVLEIRFPDNDPCMELKFEEA